MKHILRLLFCFVLFFCKRFSLHICELTISSPQNEIAQTNPNIVLPPYIFRGRIIDNFKVCSTFEKKNLQNKFLASYIAHISFYISSPFYISSIFLIFFR